MQLNLIRTIKLYENLTVEAILEKSYEKAVKALTIHPLINSYPIAKSLWTPIRSATRAILENYHEGEVRAIAAALHGFDLFGL